MAFDAATVLLSWATGGLAFLWVTARRREVGLGYGWLLRSCFGAIAIGAGLAALRWPYRVSGTGITSETVTSYAATAIAAIAAGLVVLATGRALVGSVVRRTAASPLAESPLAESPAASPLADSPLAESPAGKKFQRTTSIAQTRVADDAIAPLLGAVGLIALAIIQGVAEDAGLGPTALHAARLIIGAAFLGVVSDAMLLGHWYLVQPGLRREPLFEMVAWLRWLWPLEVAVLLVPVGMLSVFSGTIDDGYGGVLGWFWIACAITTIVLALVAVKALAEPQYAAVMAATGLLYLAILSGFGTDLVARLVLAA